MGKSVRRRGTPLGLILIILLILGIGSVSQYLEKMSESKARELQEVITKYYEETGVKPTKEEYKKTDIESICKGVQDYNGEVVTIAEEDIYYAIDYTKLTKYIERPKRGYMYVIREEDTKVYILSGVMAERKEIYKSQED